MKLLLAEDTKDLSRAVCAVLTREGYAVDAVYDGQEAWEHLQKVSYDGILLDIMMPKMSGLEVLSRLRAGNILTPVLMLTARTEVDDRVAGLDAGADDYLTKPFAMKELLARVRAMTRRRSAYSAGTIAYGDIVLEAESFELRGENTVRLSVKEFELLQTLLMNAGHELATGYLLEHVWGNEPEAGEDTVWLYVSYLNRKLEAVSSCTRIGGSRGGCFKISENEESGGRKE